jgi:hypothetical protein
MTFSVHAYSQIPSVSNRSDTAALHRTTTAFLLPEATKSRNCIPNNYYARHLGFFCRQELKMQQLHVPVTFRLGSTDYCNYLERKPGYR